MERFGYELIIPRLLNFLRTIDPNLEIKMDVEEKVNGRGFGVGQLVKGFQHGVKYRIYSFVEFNCKFIY